MPHRCVAKLRAAADVVERDGTQSQVGLSAGELRAIAYEFECTRADLENTYRAALAEPGGVDLVQRLTTHAISVRPKQE